MNAIELINANREKIVEALKAAERKSYLYPSCEYRVYIDTNGDAGDEEWLAHGSAWFEFRDGYFRHYIHTFCRQYCDEWEADEIDEFIIACLCIAKVAKVDCGFLAVGALVTIVREIDELDCVILLMGLPNAKDIDLRLYGRLADEKVGRHLD